MKKIKLPVVLNIDELISSQTNQLKEFRAKKNGELTPKELLKVLMNEIVHDDVQDLIVIRKNKDGDIVSGWTYENAPEALGALEIVKQHIIEEIRL